MVFRLGDRVREISISTGTGAMTLGGPPTGFQAFSAALQSGDTCWYVISLGPAWECGLGTFTAPVTLARTQVLASSNGGAAVDFPAGMKDVYIDVPARAIAGWAAGGVARGYLYGLTLANNVSDATNDIDVAAGEARDESHAVTMVLGAAVTKRLDAGWAAGSGQGGRYSGAAIANTTYHVWLVSKAGGLDVDIYLDPSAVPATVLGHLQGETGGADYLYVRRIGSVLRESGSVIAFLQTGDLFMRGSPFSDFSPSGAVATALVAFSVPSGIVVRPVLAQRITINASSANAYLEMTSAGLGAGASKTVTLQAIANSTTQIQRAVIDVFNTNTSRQAYLGFVIASGSGVSAEAQTIGWIDTRGRQ